MLTHPKEKIPHGSAFSAIFGVALSPLRIRIEVMPTGNLFKAGHRIGLKISGADNEEHKTTMDVLHLGHLWSQTPNKITIYHDSDHPTHLLLPITRGNIIGTFLSGGDISLKTEG